MSNCAEPSWSYKSSAGLTLIELLIAIALGSLLVLGLTGLIVEQSSTRKELEKATRQIENGRYAMALLRSDLQLAGFYGEMTETGVVPTSVPDPCQTTVAALRAALPIPVQGYDAPASVPAPLSACLAVANHKAGTDILVIRHAEPSTVSVGAASAKQVYVQSGLSAPLVYATILDLGDQASNFVLKDRTGATNPLRRFLTKIYFVSPCNVPANGGAVCTGAADDGGQPIPTLKMLELAEIGGSLVWQTIPLAEGIDNLQIDYGIDSAGADGSPDAFTKNPGTAADWANVVSVQLNILARNNELTAGHTDTKTYDLGLAGSTVALNDQYKRHVFSQHVRIVNQSSRREK